MSAMKLGGNSVELASRTICYSKRHSLDILHSKKETALEDAERIINDWKTRDITERPQVWITYHPYCKAPDWIGPLVSKAFDIPYITIEAARTGQNDGTEPWAAWRKEAQTGIKQADLHLVFKPSDRTYLTQLLGSDERLREFPTFVDVAKLSGTTANLLPEHWLTETPVLITAGMMRAGKKDKNFYMLADVLAGIVDVDWNLIIVGGGPEEAAIREAFSGIPHDRIHWTGQIEQTDVLKWMQASDVFIWPGWKEPIGMVYLEAQAQELPVIAYESMGVPLVVEHGKTGLLAPESDVAAMRENIRQLLGDTEMRNAMGIAAKSKVFNQHSMEAASARINEILNTL